jgi:hypothetical protein
VAGEHAATHGGGVGLAVPPTKLTQKHYRIPAADQVFLHEVLLRARIKLVFPRFSSWIN